MQPEPTYLPHAGPLRLDASRLCELVRPLESYADWDEALAALLDDEIESQVVAMLAAELDRDGCFREPLLIDDGVLVGGYHRLCAALRRGVVVDALVRSVAELPGHCGEARDGGPEEIELVLSLSDDLDEHDQDRALSAVRSFPYGPDGTRWCDADVVSLCEGVLRTYPRVPVEHADEIAAAAVRRLANVGVRATVVGVGPATP